AVGNAIGQLGYLPVRNAGRVGIVSENRRAPKGVPNAGDLRRKGRISVQQGIGAAIAVDHEEELHHVVGLGVDELIGVRVGIDSGGQEGYETHVEESIGGNESILVMRTVAEMDRVAGGRARDVRVAINCGASKILVTTEVTSFAATGGNHLWLVIVLGEQ